MQFNKFLAAAAVSLCASSAFAADIMISDPYVRVSTAKSKSGAAFMTIMNHGETDDQLIAATSEISNKTELHTHKEDDNGVMKMLHVEEGFAIPAGGAHMLERGGDHVMFLGLTESLEQGDVVTLTLTFEKAGDITVDVPVDLKRKPMHGGGGHGEMKHNH